MKKNAVLCSTGTFVTRRNNRNYRLIFDVADKLMCDGFEFMLYESWYGRELEIARDLAAHGLYFPVFHADKLIGDLISNGDIDEAVSRFSRNCDVASIIGAEKAVLHLWGGVNSGANMEENYSVYERLYNIAQEHSLCLTVENIVCARLEPLAIANELKRLYPDIIFTFDIRMAAFHRYLDEIYDGEYKQLFCERVRHIHVSDYSGEYMDFTALPAKYIGNGTINFERFFSFLRTIAYSDSITLEAPIVNESGIPNLDAANKALSLLKTAFFSPDEKQ